MSQSHIFFKVPIFLSLLLLSHSVLAENFRVRKVVCLEVPEKTSSETVRLGISDALLIKLPQEHTYLSGIELNIKIPEEIASWRDSVAYTLYDSLTPPPDEKKIDYKGEKVFLSTIPARFSMTLYFPLTKDFSIKENPYSLIIQKMPEVTDSIFLRFQQVMKGVPDSLERAELEINAKPVLSNKGKLTLSINPPSRDEKKYTVLIDGSPAGEKTLLLNSGEHHLSIQSDSYRNELRTFRIEQAKTTELSLSLRTIEPTLKILSPSNSEILLDGKKFIPNEEKVITPGDHKITFTFGDYELVKTLTAVKGRSYTVSLNIEANISEEQ